MRRFGGLVIAAGVACGELREANEPAAGVGTPEAGIAPGADASEQDPKDAGARDVDRVRPPCPAPCEPERISSMTDLGALAIDSFNLYVAGANAGIYQFDRSGKQTKKLGNGKTTRLALANNQVFWGEQDQLVSCSTNGCGGIPMGRATDQVGIDEVVSDGTHVAWHVRVGTDDFIRSCLAEGCSTSNVEAVSEARGLRAGMGVGDGKVFWADLQSELKFCSFSNLPCVSPSTLGPGSDDVAVWGDTAYWVYQQNLVSCPLAGCDNFPKKLASSPSPHLLVLDDDDVYWRDMVDGTILRCARGGCAAPEVLATEVKGVYYGGLVLDEEYLYWTAKDGLWRRHK